MATSMIPDVMPTAVMGTNDSCMVSKRSVEMLYYPKPHFYQYFVKNPKKRTALLNRGYFLRMKTIEHQLRSFLKDTPGRKVILNLGCGYDALPFRFLTCHPELCLETVFLDIDYETLLRKKIEIIQQHEELASLLLNPSYTDQQTPVILRSNNYLAAACDLSKPALLQSFLDREFQEPVSYLIIAEVSITYMPVEAADALLAWLSKLKSARFCLLEQCLPRLSLYPFAATMLNHFNKLSSPIRVVQRYPRISDQQQRFRHYGWSIIESPSLWEFWNDERSSGAFSRTAVEKVEIFDEYEEFALFANHYFVLIASSNGGKEIPTVEKPPQVQAAVIEKAVPIKPFRKDGAIYEIDDTTFVYHGGDDGRSRVTESVLYHDSQSSQVEMKLDSTEPPPRKHHSITKLNSNNDYLLVGGRQNPENVLRDCWLRRNGDWTRVDDLPVPLFRHSATLHGMDTTYNNVGNESVVVFGGKISQTEVSNAWYIWNHSQGWRTLRADKQVTPLFSSNLMYISALRAGLLFGGIEASGTVFSGSFAWTIQEDKVTYLASGRLEQPDTDTSPGFSIDLCRFGSKLVQHRDMLILVGGVSRRGLPDESREILRLAIYRDGHDLGDLKLRELKFSGGCVACWAVQPMLMGHAVMVQKDHMRIIGGGAVCFAFGSYMNTTNYNLKFSQDDENHKGMETAQWNSRVRLGRWTVYSQEMMGQASENNHKQKPATPDLYQSRQQKITDGFIGIKRFSTEQKQSLTKVVAKGKPCVFAGVELGSCTETWTTEYLKQGIGSDCLVDIYRAKDTTMKFESKTLEKYRGTFGGFIDDILAGQRLCLKAASQQGKSQQANLYKEFESLSGDFKLPSNIQIPEYLQHSSVLCISGQVSMPLHYDTLPNILCQIRGSQRVLVFSPRDVAHLKLTPGGMSSGLNVFDTEVWRHTLLKHTHAYEVVLYPGDVLYSPALWCHTTLPMDEYSVAINVLFKTDDIKDHGSGIEVDETKDAIEYEQAREDIHTAMERLASLSKDSQRFYMERLADEMLQTARKKS